MHPNRIVLHVAGPDRPGVTARLTEIVAAGGAELVNIGQSVLHGYLILSAIVDIPPHSSALRDILFAVRELGLRLEVSAFEPQGEAPRASPGLCVTVLGSLSDGIAVARVTRLMAERSMNILEIHSLSRDGLTGLELIADLGPAAQVESGELAEIRGTFLMLGSELGVDLAVQRDDIFRRNKRLVCMDVDSTFVKGEFIDELANLLGVKDRVGEITARAMRGEIDFKSALCERVQLLQGLRFERARALAQNLRAYAGSRTLRTNAEESRLSESGSSAAGSTSSSTSSSSASAWTLRSRTSSK